MTEACGNTFKVPLYLYIYGHYIYDNHCANVGFSRDGVRDMGLRINSTFGGITVRLPFVLCRS